MVETKKFLLDLSKKLSYNNYKDLIIISTFSIKKNDIEYNIEEYIFNNYNLIVKEIEKYDKYVHNLLKKYWFSTKPTRWITFYEEELLNNWKIDKYKEVSNFINKNYIKINKCFITYNLIGFIKIFYNFFWHVPKQVIDALNNEAVLLNIISEEWFIEFKKIVSQINETYEKIDKYVNANGILCRTQEGTLIELFKPKVLYNFSKKKPLIVYNARNVIFDNMDEPIL